MPLQKIVEHAVACAPEAVLVGHSGSTSGHPIAAEITRAIRAALRHTWIVSGGVFPTYHWREILAEDAQIDVIVRGEGEEKLRRSRSDANAVCHPAPMDAVFSHSG